MKKLHSKLSKSKEIGVLHDNYLGAPYRIGEANAKELSEYLQGTIKDMGLNKKDFNRTDGGDDIAKKPPLEIYEYQSFFMMERTTGELTLLDGFRRLLWYNAPDHQVTVRVYKEKDLTPEQIMKLMVYLNHFKFYGGTGEYYDRGFSLAMKVIFDLNIPKFYRVFNAYLSFNETIRSYSTEDNSGTSHLTSVKERILNPMFVSDMRFIEDLVGKKLMINDLFGALLYELRSEHKDKPFDSKFFLKKCAENKHLVELHGKLRKEGKGYMGGDISLLYSTSSDAATVLNQIVPLYRNIFAEMLGGEVKKTYTEHMDDCKKLVEDLKKDKLLTKITGSQKHYFIEEMIKKRLLNKEELVFTCVVYPDKNEISKYRSDRDRAEKKESLEPGLVPYPIKYVRKIQRHLSTISDPIFGFTDKDKNKWEFRDRRRYDEVQCAEACTHTVYKCEVFVNISKAEFEKAYKER